MGLFDGFSKGRKFSDLTKYVSDFKVAEETDARGRLRRRAVYVGPWTMMRDTGPSVKARLWAALVLAFALAGCLVWTVVLNHAASSLAAVMLPLLAALFPTLYLLMGALSLPLRCRPMRRDQYMHSFIRMSRSALAIAVLTFAGLVMAFIHRAIRGEWTFTPGDWRFTGGCTGIAAAALVIIFLLRSIDLMERENSAYDGQPR